MVHRVLTLPDDEIYALLALIIRGEKGEFKAIFGTLKKQGYSKVKIDNYFYDIEGIPVLKKRTMHDISVVFFKINIFYARKSIHILATRIISPPPCGYFFITNKISFLMSAYFIRTASHNSFLIHRLWKNNKFRNGKSRLLGSIFFQIKYYTLKLSI